MADDRKNEQTPRMVNWVSFDNKSARLKRLIDENGNPGLILRVAESDAGRDIARISMENGFTPRGIKEILTITFKKGEKIPFTVSQIAEMTGGKVEKIPFDRLMSDDMIINLHERRAKMAADAASQPSSEDGPRIPAPNPDSMEVLGLNMRGEEVIRDSENRYFRKLSMGDGSVSFIHESEGGQPALFFRARRQEDLNGIAAGIVKMARKGTFHQRDFDRIIDAALEPSQDGTLDMTREAAADYMREQVLRQITNIALERDSDRSAFLQSLRISANTGFVMSRKSSHEEPLRPGAGVLSLVRRLSLGHDRVDFRGHPDLAIALPRIISPDAALQVQDMSGVPHSALSDYLTNALARRDPAGSSIFLIPGDIDEDAFDRIRNDIGVVYGLEAVADIAPGVSDGVRDGRSIKMLFIGEKRPEKLESLPQAALRSFPVATQDDLVSLEREVLRSRNRIRDFNKGEIEDASASKEDDREENIRQRPYQPLSQVGEPFTMIPRALEGATAKALQRVARDAEPYGGVDAVVSRAMGCSIGELGEILTPEQVDAIALRMNAAERGRGFLEADQTGVGKGRTMASMVNIHLRQQDDNRCVYVTESAQINVPDVMRDMKAIGALDKLDANGDRLVKVLFLTSGSEFLDVTIDTETGAEIHREITSPKPKERKQIFESGDWPVGYNMVITTYSQFNVKEDDPRAEWLRGIAGERTLLVMDEAHNALNPKSNTGRNFRSAIAMLPPQNVCFATGTPARNPRGMDLYSPLLPQGEASNVTAILSNIESGGEVAQEAFATMIAEDGTMIRRDHDLSATDYQVHLPSDEKILNYQDTMNRFSPIVEGMIDVSTQIGEIVGRAQAVQYFQMVNAGMDERQARSMTNELSQYSMSIGGPLANLSRIMMNAIKVGQVVEAAVEEVAQGRKPLITFHTTYEALMKEMIRDDDGNLLSDEQIAALPDLTIRDHIRRIHNSLYKMKIDGETLDPRLNNSQSMRAFRRFSKAARNPMVGAFSIMSISHDMEEALGQVADVDARTRLLETFRDLRDQVLPPEEKRALIEAFVELKSSDVYNVGQVHLDADRIEAMLVGLPEGAVSAEVDAGLQENLNRLRENIDPGIFRTCISDMEQLMRRIDIQKGTNTEVRARMKNFEAMIDRQDDDRAQYDAINETFARIEALIDQIPDLPVSPVDAIIERLEANDIPTGEISGRNLCYRDGRIQKRGGRQRKEVVDAFNSGDLGALIYNSAGATGGSYHAGKTFADQRPRTLIEFEAPLDVIKYVQAQGRGNRYDQVASPKVLSVVTGLTPEMRIFQQRNAKLRSLGASVDGNRSHPLLLDDVPDLLNKVGDEATRNVLLSNPSLARRLGFPKFAEEDMLEVEDADGGNDDGSGVAKSGLDSLANKVLARSIMLPAHEQEDLIQRIRMEFDVLIEELESRNANPLRPKEFGGQVDIKTWTIFSGQELEEGDLDTSVFLSPVYMSTGEHDMGEDPIAAERLVTMVERAITMHGSDGFKPYADRINQNLAGLLRPYLPTGYDIDQALANPEAIPGRFAREHAKITDLAWILENLQPGVALRFPSVSDMDGRKMRTVVDLVPPKDPSFYSIPSAYKIKTICPGDCEPETIAVSRMLSNNMENIIFRPGVSNGFNEAYLNEFSQAAYLRRMMPVQILGGNILQAITIANEHDLGTISLYRDTQGQIHRGILVHDSKIDMRMLPVPLQSALVAAETATEFCRTAGAYDRADSSSLMRIWGSMDPEAKGPGARDTADIIIRMTSQKVKIDMQPIRTANADFYLSRPGLYEAIHGKPIPDPIPDRAWRKPGTNHKYLAEFSVNTPEGRDRLYTVLHHLSGVPMMTDGAHRDLTNEVLESINRDGPRGLETEHPVGFFDAPADVVNQEEASFEVSEFEDDFEGVQF